MKLKFLTRSNEAEQETKPVGKKTKKEPDVPLVKTERSLLQIPVFSQYNALMKLRIVVGTIFLLWTVAVVLLFVNEWVISAALLLLGYIMLFVLLLKLFRIKII